MATKKLYRSRENAMIGGVCAGLADYFNIDPTLVRLATVILIFPGGLSIWAYIIAWVVIPQKPLISGAEAENAETGETSPLEEGAENEPKSEEQDKSRMIVGIVLVAVGALFLLNAFDIFFWVSFGKIWPAALIVIGIAVIYKAMGKGGGKDES